MPLIYLIRSSVGKKIINGLSGLGLILFIIVHLGGNLTLFSPDSDLFNGYAHKLHEMGVLLYVAEIGLLVLFLVHIVSAIDVTIQNRRSRAEKYVMTANAGAPSRKSFSSQTMILSGLILLVFIVWHVISFRFGPGVEEGYVTIIKGEEARDLYRLVYEFFSTPLNVILYVLAMVFLGFHLRHGFWSALQTLGLNRRNASATVYSLAFFVALVFAVGFLLIPIWIYFRVNGGS